MKNIYFPMLVVDESSGENALSIWQKFDTLPENIKSILTAREMPFLLEKLQREFRLADEVVKMISLAIRQILFKQIELSSVEVKIKDALVRSHEGDPSQAKVIVEFIDREILHLIPKSVGDTEVFQEPVSKAKVEQLPVLNAIVAYPQLGQQTITAGRIKLKGQVEPQRGSLNNWIRAYRDELGVGFHDEVQRGHFLFQSVNGKNLSPEERDRLNIILKSIEEDLPLNIDPVRQIILFPPTMMASQSVSPHTMRPITPRDFVTKDNSPMTTIRGTVPRSFTEPSKSPAFVDASLSNAAVKRVESSKASELSIQGAPSVAPAFPGKTFRSFISSPAKNIAGETLHFSTGHVLPAEHRDADPSSPRAEMKPSPSPTSSSPPVYTPFSIRPLRLRNEKKREEDM